MDVFTQKRLSKTYCFSLINQSFHLVNAKVSKSGIVLHQSLKAAFAMTESERSKPSAEL